MQHEITEKKPLLDTKGRVTEFGYARSLILDYNRKDIKASAFRIKEWDYYLIYNKDYAVALTVSDNGYMGFDSISLLDFRNKSNKTKSIMNLFPLGKKHLPYTSEKGDVLVKTDNYLINFKRFDDHREFIFRMNDFKDAKPIEGNIYVDCPKADSIVNITPFNDKSKAFYYNQKTNCMPSSGKVTFDNQEYIFNKEDSFAVLDWGRGVWTYKNTWYWASASGVIDGHLFGLNIGYGYGDNSAASKNMLFYDNVGHKLEKVELQIPQKDGKDDFLSPWKVTSSDHRLELEFVPFMDRASNMDYVVLGSNQHQVFGKYNGYAILDDGKKIELKDFVGFAEKVCNKW